MEGIDKVKKVVKVTFDVLLQYKTATKDDGKISAMEYLGFVDEAIALVGIVPQFKSVLAQLQDVDDAETIELIEYIKSFGVLQDKAVEILSNILKALETMYDVYVENIIPIIKALKD